MPEELKPFDTVIPKSVIDALKESLDNPLDIPDDPDHAVINLDAKTAGELLDAITKGASDALALSSHFTEKIKRARGQS